MGNTPDVSDILLGMAASGTMTGGNYLFSLATSGGGLDPSTLASLTGSTTTTSVGTGSNGSTTQGTGTGSGNTGDSSTISGLLKTLLPNDPSGLGNQEGTAISDEIGTILSQGGSALPGTLSNALIDFAVLFPFSPENLAVWNYKDPFNSEDLLKLAIGGDPTGAQLLGLPQTTGTNQTNTTNSNQTG